MQAAEAEAAALFTGDFGAILLGGRGAALGAAAGLRAAPPAPRVGVHALPGGPLYDGSGNLQRFDLSLAEFEMLTASERIAWVEALERHAGTPNWFHNIQDIITYFDESPILGHMGPGTWASWADVGVLEAMQNGYRLYDLQERGIPIPVGFNDCAGAAPAWQAFFDGYAQGYEDEQLLPLWALAEQRGVNYGADAANLRAGVPAPGTAAGNLIPDFVAYGNTYRFIARLEGGGETFVQSYGPWVGDQIGGDIAHDVVDPFASAAGHLPWIGADVEHGLRDGADWAGSGLGSEAGDTATVPGFGDWFFDPRSTVPSTPANFLPGFVLPDERGPTYFMAKAAEAGVIPPLPGMTPAGGQMRLYNGTTILPSGDAVLLDGTVIGTDGTITKPGGGRIPLAGTRLNPDGSYTLSDGTLER